MFVVWFDSILWHDFFFLTQSLDDDNFYDHMATVNFFFFCFLKKKKKKFFLIIFFHMWQCDGRIIIIIANRYIYFTGSMNFDFILSVCVSCVLPENYLQIRLD